MTKKHILFVDDQELVIQGIQRQLRPYREQWRLYFATSGAQALAIMAAEKIDLVVSDMMMPGMHGYELLKTVAERYPGVVRIMLSGYTDENNLKQSLEVAHQYLSKPCGAETLREALSQIFKIQDCINDPLIAGTLGDANALPSLPAIYRELNAAIADENTTTKDIADIFARDMVLSARLLQLINSPYFGLNRVVSSLTDAINLIGIKRLNNLVLSVHVKTAFPIASPELERKMEYLWQNAGRVGELARLIALAEHQREDRPDQAYLGGLLHNMGLLLFLSRGGGKTLELLARAKRHEQPITALETEIFGFNRCQAAAYVLSLWKIPPRIIEAILLHYTPNETDYDGVNALTAVHVAACLLQPANPNDYSHLFEMQLDEAYLRRLGKWERLAEWRALAEKVAEQAGGSR